MATREGPVVRSRRYPSLSLERAVEAVRAIEREYRTAPVDRDTAAKLIGFQGLSGAAASALGALREYGLMELAARGTSVVTDAARSILYGTNEERLAALKKAADSPLVFQVVRNEFPDLRTPPMSGVVRVLNKMGLRHTAVPIAARAFIQTQEFLRNEEKEVYSRTPQAGPSDGQIRSEDSTIPHAELEDAVELEERSSANLTLESPVTAQLAKSQWIECRLANNNSVSIMSTRGLNPGEIRQLILILETQRKILEIAAEDQA